MAQQYDKRLYDHAYAMNHCTRLSSVTVGHVEFMIFLRTKRLPTLEEQERATEAELLQELKRALFLGCMKEGLITTYETSKSTV